MKTLAINLKAPLQSFGNEATFIRRTTDPYPSKSAVIGMLAAALGYQRDDERIETLNDLLFAVRIDQPGKILHEFQTVEWKKDTRKITYRDYLQDAVFVAAIGSHNDALIDELEAALHHPKFQLYLGRRSNAPAGVIKTHLVPDKSPIEVLKVLDWQASDWYQQQQRHHQHQQPTISVEVVADAKLLPEKSSFIVKDHVISFDQRNRRYGFREAATTEIQLNNPDYKEHDPMSFL